MRPDNCYWKITPPAMEGTVQQKVREYLRRKLIVPLGEEMYRVDPTPGRNQPHTVDWVNQTCTCQGFANANTCSHIKAVQTFLAQGGIGGRDYYEGLDRAENESVDEQQIVEESKQDKDDVLMTFGGDEI